MKMKPFPNAKAWEEDMKMKNRAKTRAIRF
jgi:hypothetical protein